MKSKVENKDKKQKVKVMKEWGKKNLGHVC
jgi:hypothetical protein